MIPTKLLTSYIKKPVFELDPSLRLAYSYIPDAAVCDLTPGADHISSDPPQDLEKGTSGPPEQPPLWWDTNAAAVSYLRLQLNCPPRPATPVSHGIFLTGLSLQAARPFGLKCMFANPSGAMGDGNMWSVTLQAREGGAQDTSGLKKFALTFRVKDGEVMLNAPQASAITRTGFPAGTTSLRDRAFTNRLPVRMELLFDPLNHVYKGTITMLRPEAIPLLAAGDYPPGSGTSGVPPSFFDTATIEFTPNPSLPSPLTAAGVNLVQAEANTASMASVDLFYFQIFQKARSRRVPDEFDRPEG